MINTLTQGFDVSMDTSTKDDKELRQKYLYLKTFHDKCKGYSREFGDGVLILVGEMAADHTIWLENCLNVIQALGTGGTGKYVIELR